MRFLTTARLRALVMVVEHRSFSVAARTAGISQPTRDAQRLAGRARLAFREIAQARAELDALRGTESGRHRTDPPPAAATARRSQVAAAG